MSTFEEVLTEFYTGEVAGEVIYSELYTHYGEADQKRKLAALMQLETEAKAWLRPHLVARGLDVAERSEDRERGAGLAAQVKPLPWLHFMRALEGVIDRDLVPRFEGFLTEAVARGDPTEQAVCRYMVEHEKAQSEFARREAAGQASEQALAPVTRMLTYPIAAG